MVKQRIGAETPGNNDEATSLVAMGNGHRSFRAHAEATHLDHAHRPAPPASAHCLTQRTAQANVAIHTKAAIELSAAFAADEHEVGPVCCDGMERLLLHSLGKSGRPAQM